MRRRLPSSALITMSAALVGLTIGCERGAAPRDAGRATAANSATETTAAELVAVPRAKTEASVASAVFCGRRSESDVRVFVFNVDSAIGERDYVGREAFRRVLRSTQPDIVSLQEVGERFDDDFCVRLLTECLPLEGGKWHVFRGQSGPFGNVIASRWPLTMTGATTTPPAFDGRTENLDRDGQPRAARISFALVDLPDDRYERDLYVLNTHFKCCGGFDNDPIRQQEADAVIAWLHDAKTPGGAVDLPADTPFLITGDLNLVGGVSVLQSLLAGDVSNETRFGSDMPMDWDGTEIRDAEPLHNGAGPANYTWRNDNDRWPPGRLDYVLYSDSALQLANAFVLNTTMIDDELLQQMGLEKYDVVEAHSPIAPGVDTKYDFDHLPLVVDFELVAPGVAAALPE